ncbi:MAB_1171c family putative transporter [Streptomyces bottropensis]|uniref:MAB_1171c family putative transporter n=1 Tax=Streptomyces bottropensis TaxID=42235 RepID=UPI0037A04DE6
MGALIYYTVAVVLWVGFAAQLPGLRENWRNPFKRAFCTVILLAGASFAFGAPPTVSFINRTTGVPNAAACITYGVVNAFSAASIVLIVNWHGVGGPERVRYIVRNWLIAYSVVIALQVALFVFGDASVERTSDFDTYYATTPLIREMIVLYLVAHLVAAVIATVLCGQWARQLSGWTRKTLGILVLGWLCSSGYSAAKIVAVAGRWNGHRWDALSTHLAPLLAAAGATLTTTGVILPLLSNRIDTLIEFFRLGPLFSLVGTSNKKHMVPTWRSRGNIELRLTQRRIAILDGLKDMAAHFDETVRDRAYRQALASGSTTSEAEAIGDAAMVAVAALSHTHDQDSSTDQAVLASIALDAIAGTYARTEADERALDISQPSLIRMSRVIHASIVEGAVRAELAQSRQE